MPSLKSHLAFCSPLLLLVACASVGDRPTAPAPAPASTVQVPAATAVISAAALEARLAAAPAGVTVLDVRTAEEFAAGHVPGARNIPVAELQARIGELAAARDRDLVVYCRTGRRAATATGILGTNGFLQLLHLEGDMQGWSDGGHRVEGMAQVEPAPQR
jgi:rhodanese-related sulfurtransferase